MIIDITGKLVIDERVRSWCMMPYPGHPNGCPNYNHSNTCPPKVPVVSKVFDLEKQHWFIIEEFNLALHAKSMVEKHPGWSDRQSRCCLYWQNGVRKRLREACNSWIRLHAGYGYTLIPEALGVNVFRTAHRYDIMIRKNPSDIVYKVALVGSVLNENVENTKKDIYGL